MSAGRMFDQTLETYRLRLRTMDQSETEKYDQYLKLALYYNSYNVTKDKKSKEEIVGLIKELLEKIPSYNARDIYKFTENSATFKQFIQGSDCPLTTAWPNQLKANKALSFAITSLDQETELALLNQYLGLYLYKIYQEERKKLCDEKKKINEQAEVRDEEIPESSPVFFALTLACETGLFEALRTRCNIYQEKIKANHNEDCEQLRQTLEEYTLALGNLYGSFGFFHGAHQVWMDIGNFYANLKTDRSKVQAQVFYSSAAEHYLCGKEIFEKEIQQDHNIIKSTCGPKGLKVFGIENWDAANQEFLGKIDAHKHGEIREKAKQRVKELLPASHNAEVKNTL